MDGPISEHLSRRSMTILAVFGLTMFLVDFGPGWVLTYHEAFFAVPAREMLRSGDWVVPRVVGVPAWQKPPLTHWMIAITMGVLRTEAEWAVRLPTLLCTIANAILIGALAARWHGDRIGRLTGLIQLTTFYVLFQGRLAECDMPLCAAVSGAMLAFASGTIGRDRCGIGTRLAFFGLAGAATLIKGPFALGLIGGAAGLYAILERRWSVWRFLLDPLGWVVMLALVLVWPIAAYNADPTLLDALRVHNLDRFSGTYEGGRGTFFYLYMIPLILLPWTPLAFGGFASLLRDPSRPKALWRLMICWMIVGAAILSASAWKHKHYPIPVLPPLSIAAAYGLDRYLRARKRDGVSPAACVAAVLAIGGAVVATVLAAKGATTNATIAGLMVLAGCGLLLTSRLFRAGRTDASLASLFGTVWLVVVLDQSFVLPRFDLYRESATVARATNARVSPDTVIHQVGVPNPQVSFYLRWPMRRFDDAASFYLATQREHARGAIVVVGPNDVVRDLADAGAVRPFLTATTKYGLASMDFQPIPAQLATKIESLPASTSQLR